MKILAIILTAAVSLIQFAACANVPAVCMAIGNPACACINSTASLSLADVTCTFNASTTTSPLFSNSSFAGSVTLGTLDLSDNALDHLPDNFLSGENIGSLVLRNNSFATVPVVLTKVRALTNLDLSSNELTGLSVDVLGSIQGLEMLNLSSNRLTTLAAEEDQVNILSDLKELNLAENAIKSINGGVFSSMPRLATLQLAGNQLEEVTQSTFSQLQQTLITLDLSDNSLNQVHSQAFQPVRKMRDLNLSHNLLGQLVSTLQFPQHIQSLDLGNCGVTTLGHCHFAGLTDLTLLELHGNPLNCTCELYQLHQWYQNQGSDRSQWTCQVIDGQAGSSSGQVMAVTDLKGQCQDSYTVCPSALDLVNQCEGVQDETGSAVVGILAGVVFLAPCIVVMAYVFFKDYSIIKNYQLVDDGKDVEKQEPGSGEPVVISIGADGSKPNGNLQGSIAEQSNAFANVTSVVVMHSIDVNDVDVKRSSRVAEPVSGEASSGEEHTGDEHKKSAVHRSSEVSEQDEGISNTAFQCDAGAEKCSHPDHDSTDM